MLLDVDIAAPVLVATLLGAIEGAEEGIVLDALLGPLKEYYL